MLTYIKSALFVFLGVIFMTQLPAQNESAVVDKKKHKVVIQLTSSDTLVQKAVVKQIHNLLTAAPNTKVEVVCHNNGITFLTKAQTQQGGKIKELSDKGIDFVACQNTMRERKISREQLVETCRVVPAGVLEIVQKEEKGWSYLKAGF